jgi:hypothetical protein
MIAQDRGLTGDQISALEMLAGCPRGCSEAELKFGIGLFGGLIRDELATATPGVVKVGPKPLGPGPFSFRGLHRPAGSLYSIRRSRRLARVDRR